MFSFYKLSILNSPLSSLTYKTKEILDKGEIVKIELNKKERLGVVLEKTHEPTFKCLEILEKTSNTFTSSNLEFAKFISEYYVCSLGEALNLLYPTSLHVKESKSFTCKEKLILSKKQKEAKEFLTSHKA